MLCSTGGPHAFIVSFHRHFSSRPPPEMKQNIQSSFILFPPLVLKKKKEIKPKIKPSGLSQSDHGCDSFVLYWTSERARQNFLSIITPPRIERPRGRMEKDFGRGWKTPKKHPKNIFWSFFFCSGSLRHSSDPVYGGWIKENIPLFFLLFCVGEEEGETLGSSTRSQTAQQFKHNWIEISLVRGSSSTILLPARFVPSMNERPNTSVDTSSIDCYLKGPIN